MSTPERAGRCTIPTGIAGSNAPRILDGLRVIDCSETMAGAVAALLLAEAGADVIKVERPRGDPTRSSLGFLTWNRSKRSVVIDLETEDGRTQLHGLLEGADVLIHTFGPAGRGTTWTERRRTGGPTPAPDHQRRPGLAGRPPERRRSERRPARQRPARSVRRAAGVARRAGLPPLPLRELVCRLPERHRDPGPAHPT